MSKERDWSDIPMHYAETGIGALCYGGLPSRGTDDPDSVTCPRCLEKLSVPKIAQSLASKALREAVQWEMRIEGNISPVRSAEEQKQASIDHWRETLDEYMKLSRRGDGYSAHREEFLREQLRMAEGVDPLEIERGRREDIAHASRQRQRHLERADKLMAGARSNGGVDSTPVAVAVIPR